MALYNEGQKVNDFWCDAKYSESVFKLLAFASITGVVARFIGGAGPLFPLPETWRGFAAYWVVIFLLYLQFRYADAALFEPYLQYRIKIGKPAGKVRYWITAVGMVVLGMLWPTVAVVASFAPSQNLAAQVK